MENYVGKRLDGRYEIQDVIGVGGMAVVYKAYDSIDDRIVAVKILKDEFLANEEFRRRFKNESKAIALMSHKNIVKVYDVSFGDRLQYIVMEYIEGITLKEYIEQQGVLPWKEALFFVIQILKALQHAHDKGIVHRDIKPQNIMLLENGMIKVTDFGIARFSHGETRTMTEKAIGSVHYISPEQAKGELTDEKADIYSVGVVLYEMLTGKLPFEAESAVSVALMQVNNQPELPRTINPDLPLGFEQITMKAMQKSARDRYQSAAEFLMDLEEFRRNPSIKFDYRTYFVDDGPTRYMDTVRDDSDVKTVPPVANAHKKLDTVGARTVDAVQDIPTKRVNTRAIAVIAGVAVAVIIFIAILLVSMLKNGTLTLGVGKKIEVDNFVGMNYAEEIKDNEEYAEKFNFEPIYESFTDGEAGCVFKQDPEAGKEVTKGYTIRLYIAKSGEGQILADYSEENYKSAQNDLEAMGFKVTLEPVADSELDVGLVVKTEPAAGTSVLDGSEITIYYSASADAGKLFKMPDLTGKTLTEAKEILNKNNLVLSRTETVDSNIEKDRVTMQSPGDGSPVQEGDTVILTVSSGQVALNKTINLPKDIGTVEVEVYLNNSSVVKNTVNTNTTNKYTFELKSGNADSNIDVYVNGQLYYEVTADFSKDPVKLSGEKFYDVSFYVDVLGLSEADALAALKKAGYMNVSVVQVESTESEGTVIAQSPVSSSAPNLDKTATIVLSVAVAQLDNSSDNTQQDDQVQG